MRSFNPATRPTLYFVGVTTGQSSIMKVFPAWAKHLGLEDAAIEGVDFPLRADPAGYREAVRFIKADPLSRGALVTTHKVDLYAACRDLFDEEDRFARLMKETSCLSKPGGRLVCHAKDPISSGLAIDGFLGLGHFAETRADAFCIGAGGSAVAITWHLMRREEGREPPRRIVVSDRSPSRLLEIRQVHAEMGSDVPVDYLLADGPEANDDVLAGLRPGSLVVNATGLGKDLPGSPISGRALFPESSVAWDLNYRGDLLFLDQARAQQSDRRLRVVDGWTYFIHGWTQVIADVFQLRIGMSPAEMEVLSRLASEAAGA